MTSSQYRRMTDGYAWYMAASRKGPKPKMGNKSVSQKLMCLCTRLHCLNRTGGNGCFKCEWACVESKNQGTGKRPYFDEDMNCVCPFCTCQCSVVYYRHEEKSLAIQEKEEFLLQIDTKPQVKLSSFFGFRKCNRGPSKKSGRT